MYLQKSPVYVLLSLLIMCIGLSGLFSACSSSGGDTQYSSNPVSSANTGDPVSSGNSGNPITMPPGTGGISFGLIMQPSSSPTAHMRTPAFNSCVDYGIGTISATILSGTTTVTSNSWPCSAHQGQIIGVPAGTNYTLQVSGISGTTIWSGQVPSLTVNTGQITNAGTVTMSYVGTDTTAPTVTITGTGPNSNPANTTNVPITDRINIVFSESMAISTITSTNITLSDGTSSVPGTVSYDRASNTAAFIPSSPLSYATPTPYVLQVTACVSGSCIKDTAGNPLSSDFTTTFTTESAPGGIANQPTGLTAKPGNGQLTLDWPAVNGATSYNVYYSTAPLVTTATGTQLAGVRAPAVHLGLTNGTTYYYIVTAVNGLGESPASTPEVSATPTAPAGNPLPPASLAVTPGTGQNTVGWPLVAGATSYNLYWSTRAIYPDHTAADNVIRNIPGGLVVHSGVTTGNYCYVVTAMNSAGESADSMQVCEGGAGSIQIVWP